jgi:glycosyltransferase involved in cell wall biosynthesis
MNILIVHEIDWIQKVPFEPQHLAELFSIEGHNVFVIDCAEPNISEIKGALSTRIVKNYHQLYDDASITLIRPGSILIKGLNRLTHFLSCKQIIKKVIIENNINLILLYGVATNGIQCVQLSKELNIPLIFRALDVAHKLVKIPILVNIVRNYEKKVISNANLVLATTPHLVKYTEEMGANPKYTKYFPLGINSSYFKPMEKDHSLIQELGLNKNDKIIIFMGTLYSFSGLDYILKNFHILQNKIKQIKLLIIGAGPEFENLKSLCTNLKLNEHVIFTGFIKQNEIPKYFALAEICINPFKINSITDRILPTKILEYLSCGKPVLSTPLKGTVKLLPNENYGIIYSQQDDFINSLIQLLEDNEKLIELGNKGFSYVKENHYWDNLVNKLLVMFDETIKKSKNSI